MKEKLLYKKDIYQSSFVSIHEDTVLTHHMHEAKRIVVDHPGASAILPITTDNKIILVKQYRHPIADVSIEIPAGKLEMNEDPLLCALRECEEEAQVKPSSTKHIHSIHTCVGFSNEVIHLYIGYGCMNINNPKPKDQDEHFEILTLTIDEVKDMIKKGTITDAKTLVTLYYVFLSNELKDS
jgi:ADP-ribose pyrophosphatase